MSPLRGHKEPAPDEDALKPPKGKPVKEDEAVVQEPVVEYRAPDVIQPYAPSERVGIANAVVAPEPPSLTAVEDSPMCRVCDP